MSDSSSSQPHAKPASASGKPPFSEPPPLSIGSETILNPERRLPPQGSSVISGPRPDSELQKLLFPDFSALQAGELPVAPAGARLAHFEIIDRIGSGGMGSVFLALDTHLQRYVALKILSPSQAREPNIIQRFLNEARSAARLDFDGIARVHFYGEDKGFHFIAFEYVTGTNVRDLIQSRGALHPAEAVNYTLQIAHALKHTSAAGVVHRDIKPSNIIVTPAGRAKLVDLGLARKESSESIDDLTVAGTTLGTFDYISPEQAQDPRNVDVRSDIYSLGCTLFHMLTGEPPYPQGTLAQKLLEHQQSYVPDPASRNRRIPPELSAVVRKMMASDPKKRIQSPDALVRELLLIAQQLGLRGTTTEGLVWSASNRSPVSEFLSSYLSWIVACAVLILIVFVTDGFRTGDENPLTPSQAINDAGANAPTDDANGSTNIGAASNATSPSRAAPTLPGTIQPLPGSESQSGDIPRTIANAAGQETRNFEDPRDPEKIFSPTATDPPFRTEFGSAAVSERISSARVNPADLPIPTPVVDLSPKPGTTPDNNTTRPVTAPEAREKSIYLIRGTDPPLPFDTLEGACAEALDGSVIELRYNGPRKGEPEKPIAINRRIKIVGAAGYRPHVQFVSRPNAEESDLRMIALQSGSLELSNVHLTFNVAAAPASREQNHWALFSLGGAEQLQLQNVTATISNPRGFPTTMFEFHRGTSANFDNMKMKTGINSNDGSATANFDVTIYESVLRGECRGLLLNTTRPGNLTMTRTLIAVSDAMCYVPGASEMPREGDAFHLTLDHVTCVTGSEIVEVDTGEIRELLPLVVASRNSCFVQRPLESAPLVRMTGRVDAVDFRNDLVWRGERNYYDGFRSFWSIGQPGGLTLVDDLTFEGWLSHWAETLEGAEDRSSASTIDWQTDWDNIPFSKLAPADLRFSDDAVANDPSVRSTDGTPIGAPVRDLPAPPNE